MRKYYVTKGSYQGTVDDQIDRWYVCVEGEPPRKFRGFATKKEAERHKKEIEDCDAAWDVPEEEIKED